MIPARYFGMTLEKSVGNTGSVAYYIMQHSEVSFLAFRSAVF